MQFTVAASTDPKEDSYSAEDSPLYKSINNINGDPLILPFSRTIVNNPYWSSRHPGIATGQIKKNTQIGQQIYNLSKNTNYKTFLDIGTCCGIGTTKCLLDGIIMRNDGAKLIALETNPYFFETTKKYWSKYFEYYNIDKNKLELHNGTLVPFESLDKDFITDSGYNIETYDYNTDIKNSPTIVINEQIDVICLDGGHFSTQIEWNMLKDRCRVVILDDINTSKTRNIMTELCNSSIWEVVFKSNERCGACIAIKK